MWAEVRRQRSAEPRVAQAEERVEVGGNLARVPGGSAHRQSPRRQWLHPWGTDTNSQVYVLRLDAATAGIVPLAGEAE